MSMSSEFPEKPNAMQRVLNETSALKEDMGNQRLGTILAMPDGSTYSSSMFFGVYQDESKQAKQITLAYTETPQGATIMFGVLPLVGGNQNGGLEPTGYVVEPASDNFLQLMGEQPPISVDTITRELLADMIGRADFSQPDPVREAGARIESGSYPNGWFDAVGDNRPLPFAGL